MEKIYQANCPKCKLYFEYKKEQVYEKMIVPKLPTQSHPYGYVKNVVDCPICGYPVTSQCDVG